MRESVLRGSYESTWLINSCENLVGRVFELTFFSLQDLWEIRTFARMLQLFPLDRIHLPLRPGPLDPLSCNATLQQFSPQPVSAPRAIGHTGANEIQGEAFITKKLLLSRNKTGSTSLNPGKRCRSFCRSSQMECSRRASKSRDFLYISRNRPAD